MRHGSALRSALLSIALALPSVATADVWDEAYSRGLSAIQVENYGLAVEELQRAIAEAPNEFISEQAKNGWNEYVPHFYLGIAKFHLGDREGALREWKISEKQGVVPKDPRYAPQLRDWMARVAAVKPQAPPRTSAPPQQAQPVPTHTPPPAIDPSAVDQEVARRLAAERARLERLQAATTTAPAAQPPAATPVRPVPIPTTTIPTTTVPTTTVPTTTTAPVSSPAAADQLREANIAFDTPDQINLDEQRVIKLLLDRRRPANELEQQLHKDGETATATIRVPETVEARLTGTAFDIRPLTPDLQAVLPEETTEWQWVVTPKQSGKHRLFLTINAILSDQRKHSIRTFDRVIEVQVPPRGMGKWIVPISVLAGIVVVLLLVFALRRRTPPAVDDTVRVAETTLRTAPVGPSSDSMRFRDGQTIGDRYRIVRLLGQGGMGSVYAAEDGEFAGELVALKTMLTPGEDVPRVLARFKKEIQLARRVAHPNVCRIFDVGYHVTGPGKTIFVSMEYVTGVPLKTVIQQKGRLNEREALAIIRDVAAALDATHAAGLIHRDVKSGNVMLAEGGRAVLMDFGLACLSNPAEGELSLTRTGAIIGTPAYMAPEQIEGTPLTAATDIYAFGMVIYEMVTGRLPYEGDTPMNILAKRLREPPRTPAHFVPNLKAEWAQTILRCLEYDPSKRFRSAMDVYRALDRAADMPTLAM